MIIINNGKYITTMLEKHKSKLHKGFEKMCKRQIAKPRAVKIKLPVSNLLPKNFKGKYKHHIKVVNSIWNGMNLKELLYSFNTDKVGGMYRPFRIDSNGKYKLSIYGKNVLRRKKNKKSID